MNVGLEFLFTVAGTPSNCLAPWLDTKIAEQPAWTAFTASSPRRMPLAIIGSVVMLLIEITY